jgi:hypothetical protein
MPCRQLCNAWLRHRAGLAAGAMALRPCKDGLRCHVAPMLAGYVAGDFRSEVSHSLNISGAARPAIVHRAFWPEDSVPGFAHLQPKVTHLLIKLSEGNDS